MNTKKKKKNFGLQTFWLIDLRKLTETQILCKSDFPGTFVSEQFGDPDQP